MSGDIERNAYEGTITVMCEVTVCVGSDTGSDMPEEGAA